MAPPASDVAAAWRSTPSQAHHHHLPACSSTAPPCPVAPPHDGAAKASGSPVRAGALGPPGEVLATAFLESARGIPAALLRRRRGVDRGEEGGSALGFASPRHDIFYVHYVLVTAGCIRVVVATVFDAISHSFLYLRILMQYQFIRLPLFVRHTHFFKREFVYKREESEYTHLLF
jgi:hypothetical protein